MPPPLVSERWTPVAPLPSLKTPLLGSAIGWGLTLAIVLGLVALVYNLLHCFSDRAAVDRRAAALLRRAAVHRQRAAGAVAAARARVADVTARTTRAARAAVGALEEELPSDSALVVPLEAMPAATAALTAKAAVKPAGPGSAAWRAAGAKVANASRVWVPPKGRLAVRRRPHH